jgi:hypothetical protein
MFPKVLEKIYINFCSLHSQNNSIYPAHSISDPPRRATSSVGVSIALSSIRRGMKMKEEYLTGTRW